ncbi:hypothetical protein M422DRAFT_240913 [Sphaerobolus stellatus SS14]|nr:hypothetical protein M422DRAFT_240913 [Sphaerobolus stellatus SS14]
MSRKILKIEDVVEESVTNSESGYERESEPKQGFRTVNDWTPYEVFVHPALRPAIPISSRNINANVSTDSTTNSTITENTRKRKRVEKPDSDPVVESEKENVGLQVPKRRRIMSNLSMRGELGYLRKSLERMEQRQDEMGRQMERMQEVIEAGLGRLSDILEGGSSQLAE